MSSNLLTIKSLGQKIWLDNISREFLSSDQFKSLIYDDGISGITSNPTIFYKAIKNDLSYQNDLQQLKNTTLSKEEKYESLVIPDIQLACDIMLPIYQQSNQFDGYVSFEVSPFLSNDAEKTIIEAKRLWNTINRPNLMIKIPATKAGMLALTELIYSGINVNVTLLFSIEQLIATWNAHILGLEKRKQVKLPLDHVYAVASLFLSRIDTAVDNKLTHDLRGQTAINIAKSAYLSYQTIYSNSYFSELKLLGAKEQYLLWASTGTKNANYSDVMYVEELIGKDTINTIPDATLYAFKDHGVAKNSLTNNIELANSCVEKINNIVNLTIIGEQLQINGLQLFEQAYLDLLSLMTN